MRSSHLKGIATVVILLLFTAIPAQSQFSFEQTKDDDLDLDKPVKFYWTPRHNRVEGLFANFGARVRPESVPGLQIYGDAGWGFWNQSGEKFRFNAGIRKDFFDFNRLSVGVDVFKKLDSEDDWIIGEVENSLSSFFFREGYKDYYGVHGFRFYADHRLAGRHTLRLEVERRSYESLQQNVDWSIFRGDVDLNPKNGFSTIEEGDELGIRLIAAFDWRDNPIFPLTGWFVQAIFEHTEEDFDTDGLFLTVKRYQQTMGNQRLLLRAMLGSRTGSLFEQHVLDLGGLGNLRAYDDKEFIGNRMFMFNANYMFGGDILQKIPLQNIPYLGALWTTLSLGAFLDTGKAYTVAQDKGVLDGLDDAFDDLKTDFGLSLLVLDGVLRMDFAWRADSVPGKDDYRITFRLLESL